MFEIKVREKGLEVRRDIIVFGRRIFSWRDSYLSNERLVYDLSQRTRFIQKYHAVFDEYRGLMRGREVVVVATGSTLSQYHPITNACHIGVNRAFLSKNVPLLDFYFLQDISGAHDYIDEADVYG